MKELEKLTEQEEEKRGKLLAEVLRLGRDPIYEDRWLTTWGTKTDLGVFRVVKRIVLDGE